MTLPEILPCTWKSNQSTICEVTLAPFVRWDLRSSDSNSVMTFKRFEEFVSSFCKVVMMSCHPTMSDRNYDVFFLIVKNIIWNSLQVDDKTLLASSGEGTVQSFDLRYHKPDIQSEVSDQVNGS